MNLKRGCLLGCLGLVTLFFLLIFLATGTWLTTFPREHVTFVHNVWLPHSARVLSRETPAIWWMDSHAFATVTITEKDAPEFVKHLNQQAHPRLKGSWSAESGGVFSGYSGHALCVKLKPAQRGSVEIEIKTYTD